MKLLFTILSLILLMSFTGCASMDNRTKCIAASAAAGAAIGAGSGAVIGHQGDTDNATEGSFIGAAVGGIIGGSIGCFYCEAEKIDGDSDGDGVADSKDKCPGTPKGIKVVFDGCPLDSDKDGVPDHKDDCPGTPERVKVDRSGCPLDGDGDGVYDGLDKCPRTPKGASANEFGCWVCKDVNFDFDKWDIKPESHKGLDQQVTFLKQNMNLIVEIQGHTDNVGDKNYNQALSEKRANAVKDYLIEKGITKDRLSSKGYGMTIPFASNDTEEGRAKNRRVQFSACYDLMIEE